MSNQINEHKFPVTETEAQQRLDIFLSHRPGLEITRSRVQELIKQGMVKVNGQEVKAKHPLKAGDEVTISIPIPVPLQVEAEAIPLTIVYEDEALLVINKPVGLVVHPGAGNHSHTLVNALLGHCHDLSGIGGVLRPGIVHRLDKDTSGLIIVAKCDAAHQALAAQLAERKIRRYYLTLVGGNFTVASGTIDLPIGRHIAQRQKMSTVTRHARTAVTHYLVQEQFKNCSFLSVKLDTGRTHQIRVHMAHIKHPVLGDRTYGRLSQLSLRDETGKRSDVIIPRQMLHAAKLEFTHPLSGVEMSFNAELPQDMQGVIAALRIDNKQG